MAGLLTNLGTHLIGGLLDNYILEPLKQKRALGQYGDPNEFVDSLNRYREQQLQRELDLAAQQGGQGFDLPGAASMTGGQSIQQPVPSPNISAGFLTNPDVLNSITSTYGNDFGLAKDIIGEREKQDIKTEAQFRRDVGKGTFNPQITFNPNIRNMNQSDILPSVERLDIGQQAGERGLENLRTSNDRLINQEEFNRDLTKLDITESGKNTRQEKSLKHKRKTLKQREKEHALNVRKFAASQEGGIKIDSPKDLDDALVTSRPKWASIQPEETTTFEGEPTSPIPNPDAIGLANREYRKIKMANPNMNENQALLKAWNNAGRIWFDSGPEPEGPTEIPGTSRENGRRTNRPTSPSEAISDPVASKAASQYRSMLQSNKANKQQIREDIRNYVSEGKLTQGQARQIIKALGL